MQSRDDNIKALRDILKLAKLTFCDKGLEITNENGWIYDDALSTFSMIGKEKLYELAQDVYQFLNCNDRVFRGTAVTTLGLSTRLHLSDFKNVAYEIWLGDKDDTVRNAALRVWASYYDNTKDPEVLKFLYKIRMDEAINVNYRLSAMEYIFDVSGEKSTFYDPYKSKHFYMVNSHKEFNQKVNWDEMREIMKKYAPEALT